MTSTTLSAAQARGRLHTDHDILRRLVTGLDEERLRQQYLLRAGPLGDFCESLHDLVAHILMWDEISLAALQEARAGRVHWSRAPHWETAEAGSALNRGGVLAGRELPGELLVDRFDSVCHSLLQEIDSVPEADWRAPNGLGRIAEDTMTVPGAPAYWHAALHLGELPADADRQ